ncbi:MAG: ATP-binding protein [Myxococcota bacterium]|nr:ATP-binding protein [Myxococcota bacterium]
MSAPPPPPSEPRALASPAPDDDTTTIRRRLSWLVAGRLLVATVLFGGTLALGGADLSSNALTTLVLGIYCASLLSLVWLQTRRALPALVIVQLGIDLAITTGLVWMTGGALSSFSFLYGVVILMAALIAGPRPAAATAGLSGVLYVVIGIAVRNGWLPELSGQPGLDAPGELDVALLRNVVGLFLVGMLANVLSERLRRAGGALRLANESAERYARLTEDIVRSLGSGLITTDLESRVRTINRAGSRILGARAEELVGTPLSDILPRASAVDSRERGEAVAARTDGTEFPVGFTRSPLLGPGGDLRGSLVLFQDLTEITQLRDKAEKAERLAVLGRLAAGLAHEIRNPLGSISGSVELVREAESLSDEDKGLLGMVIKEVERLNELVTTMLEVGRPAQPERAEVDVRSLAAEVAMVARRGPSAAAGVEVRLDPGDDEVRSHADPAQIRQVLWNLVKNAVQFSARGGVVTVRVRMIEGAPAVEVEDRGKGIAEEDRDHLFDMFFTKRHHGVGLGLALVKQIVDAHGGRIELESREGEGSLFRVILPPAQSDRERAVSA